MAEIKRLRLVAGNKVTLIIPMQKVVFTQAGKTTENYYPPTGTEIGVTLQGQYRKYEFVPTVTENNIIFTDNGTLAVGEYAVVITVKEPDDTKRRSKWLMVVTVYDSNEPVVSEFDDFPDYAEGAIIEGSVFFFAKGDKGDPGEGVPEGGATGQVLRKKSNEDYDTEWADESVTSVNGKTGAVTLIAEDVKALPDSTPIPDSTSDLLNDSGFITKTVDDLVNYYLKRDIYTKDEVQQIVSAIKQFRYEVVPTLPEPSAETMHCIYLAPSADPQAQNIKDEYITIQSDSQRDVYFWEQIGSTAIDLSGYYTSAETDNAISNALTAALADYTTTNDLTILLAGKQDKEVGKGLSTNDFTDTDKAKVDALKTVATTGSYNDLIDKPTIPAAQVNSDWDAVSGVAQILNKPTIPAAQVNSDWNASSGVAQILNKPTNVSAFNNDAGYLTQHQDISGKQDKMSIVTWPSISDTVTVVTGSYNKLSPVNTINTLQIRLSHNSENKIQTVVIYMETGTTPAITWVPSTSGEAIYIADGFEIEASSTYEVSALWNGTNWYVAGIKLINTASV